uniref:DUF1758 domain-containing protein n=1 Tax=Heterorhabditis bacteriophora TaxID=37862 RepID=A0A1I7XJE3_HETBA
MGGKKESFLSNMVKVELRTGIGRTIEVQLSTKPILTNPFETAILSPKDMSYLEEGNFVLTNPRISGERIKPSVIIGVDLWTDFVRVTQASVILPSGLIIQPTIFGYAVQGCSKSPTAENSDDLHRLVLLLFVVFKNTEIGNQFPPSAAQVVVSKRMFSSPQLIRSKVICLSSCQDHL